MLNLDTKTISKTICHLCDSETDVRFLFREVFDFEYETYKPVDFVVCEKCNLIFQKPLPEKSEVKNFYPKSYRNYLPVGNGFFQTIKKAQFKNLAKKLTRYFTKDSKILEIGFGNGQLLIELKKLGYRNLYGGDFSDSNFKNLEAESIKLSASDIEESFPFNEKFDVIIMNNVIEHFLDPFKVLASCKSHLTPEGKIIFLTPNTAALDFKIFKRYWAGLHTPRHTFLFNMKNLKKLANKMNFSRITHESIIDPGQWAISVQNYFQNRNSTKNKLKNGMAFYTVFLSLLFLPVSYIQNIIGKSSSLLVVLEN